MNESKATIPPPSPKVLQFLQWAIGAAANEFFGHDADYTNYDAARAWLGEIEEICGYAPTYKKEGSPP